MSTNDDEKTSEETFDWKDLLRYIRAGNVIPIVGRDLLVMTGDDGRPTLLDHHLARHLAKELGVKYDVSKPSQLHEVALRYMAGKNTAAKIYSGLKEIVDNETAKLPIPEPLAQLAAITDFKLFLSTTFDALMLRALNERAGMSTVAGALAYSPFRKLEKLPLLADGNELAGSLVYQIFGRASLHHDYAVTEEDILEFMHSLQSERTRPDDLLDYLKEKQLLLLGCAFPDWLARFFIRTIRNERLHLSERPQTVADDRVRQDGSLLLFLKHYETRVYIKASAVEFVAELYARWHGAPPPPPSSTPVPVFSLRPMPEGAIFLSHAREDAPLARMACDALTKVGLDVWFEERDVPPGIDWTEVIHENIWRCSIFLPLLSRHTVDAAEETFEVEWRLAIERSSQLSRAVPFIVPVVLDDTSRDDPGVLAALRRLPWERANDGALSSGTVERLVKYIRRLRAPGRH